MRDRLRVLVTTTVSDAHTWNLVLLRLHIEELGHTVTGLGPCTPVPLVLATGIATRPDLIVVSSVNGHGARDGVRLAEALRAVRELASTPAVIGGKLGIGGRLSHVEVRELRHAGFHEVFDDGDLDRFTGYLTALASTEDRDAS